jgi:hypothetical protein
LQYELADVLSTPEGVRLMKPTRWIGRAAIPIASISLVFDALLLPTPLTLLLLAFLWGLVAGPYVRRSRRRKRKLFRRFPQHSLVDPDALARARIARVFLIIAMIVWSGAWQRVMIYISMPWLDTYADQLYDVRPMEAPLPTAWVCCGVLPVVPTYLSPGGVAFNAGFGTLDYSPPRSAVRYWSTYLPVDGWKCYSEPSYTQISPAWSVRRPPWNILSPFPRLDR